MLAMISGTPASRALSIAMRSALASTRTERVARTTGRAGPPVAVDDGAPSRGRSIISAIADVQFYGPFLPQVGQSLQIDRPCTKWYNAADIPRGSRIPARDQGVDTKP